MTTPTDNQKRALQIYEQSTKHTGGTTGWHAQSIRTHMRNAWGVADADIAWAEATYKAKLATPTEVPPAPPKPVWTGTDADIVAYLRARPEITDVQIRAAMDNAGVSIEQMARATGAPLAYVTARYNAAGAD